MKKINRNAFNEKLIHRYLFERYYFVPKNIRNKLLSNHEGWTAKILSDGEKLFVVTR